MLFVSDVRKNKGGMRSKFLFQPFPPRNIPLMLIIDKVYYQTFHNVVHISYINDPKT